MSKKPYVRLGSALASVFLTVAALIFFVASGSSQKIVPDRILRQIDSSRLATLKGTAHPLARAEFDRGRMNPDRQLSNVAVTFRLSPAQEADLHELLREQQDPSSHNYHRWLTPEQYASRFGMTGNDLGKVSSWLQSQGLRVEGISRNRNEISFSGSVGQIEYALKTELHNYSINGEQRFANAADISLPAAFADQVLGVRGLNDFHPKPRIRKPLPKFTSNISGNHFVIPGDFATIYDLPANVDGTGVTIAVVGQTQISTTDMDNFRAAANLPARTSSNFIQTLVPGTGTGATCTGDETEADLDLEWSEGVASNATINFVYAGLGSGTGNTCNNRTANVFDALHYAITNDVAPIVSISYGNCEANLGSSFVQTMQQWAQEANAQGQTISGPAGDSGAADCDTGNSATQGLAVDVPASIPEVTGVGGSEFTGDPDACANGSCSNNVAPAGTYWSGASTLNSGPTALQYIPEEGWDDTTATSGLDATGGGASTIFGKPSWQAGAGVPSDGKRDVPDIALNASNAHDPYLICSHDFYIGQSTTAVSCGNGFRTTDSNTNATTTFNNSLSGVGGTSAGAPTFAGILALINQATNSQGLGNVNPMLYSLAASSPAAFHDITSGNNNVPCTSGTTNCAAGTTSIGFSAGAGYDQVTGLGSLDVAQLISAWKGVTPAGDFSLDGLVASAAAAGGSGTSSVTVSALGGFTGAVNLSCTTSSTSKVSCSVNPSSVTLTSSATGQTTTASVTISSTADLRLPDGRKSHGLWFASTGGIFAAVLLGGVPSRRRRYGIFLFLMFVIAMTALGCGGGSSPVPVQQSQGPQLYSVTVTGTGTNSAGTALSHSTTFSFTVQ